MTHLGPTPTPHRPGPVFPGRCPVPGSVRLHTVTKPASVPCPLGSQALLGDKCDQQFDDGTSRVPGWDYQGPGRPLDPKGACPSKASNA